MASQGRQAVLSLTLLASAAASLTAADDLRIETEHRRVLALRDVDKSFMSPKADLEFGPGWKKLSEDRLRKYGQSAEDKALFEPTFGADHHDHLICTKCGIIVEFVDAQIEELQMSVASEHGFIVTNHKMELYGLCAKCR